MHPARHSFPRVIQHPHILPFRQELFKAIPECYQCSSSSHTTRSKGGGNEFLLLFFFGTLLIRETKWYGDRVSVRENEWLYILGLYVYVSSITKLYVNIEEV